MKKISIYLLMFGFLFLTQSCKESFLNELPSDSVPFDTAIKTESEMQAAVNGMYAGMRNASFFRTVPLTADLMADNVFVSALNSNRYIAQYTYSINAQNGDVGNLWADAYRVILRANQIIAASVPETAATKQLKGEAYAVRGLVHFILVNFFAKPYVEDANAVGVPIILKFDKDEVPARKSVKEVYTQVISDLTTAAGLMTVKKNSSQFTAGAAKALLNRVYLYQADWDKVIASGTDVIATGGFKLVERAGFVDYFKNAAPTTGGETCFEVNADGTLNIGFDALANMYDQAGYGDIVADNSLYTSFSDKDIRRSHMTAGKRSGQDVFIVSKYPNATNAADKDDWKVIRFAEVYLNMAEAYINKNDEANAKKFLSDIQKRRVDGFAETTATGTALKDEILAERRKEFAFEGMRFWDLARNKQTITRGTNYPAASRSIPTTDTRRIMPIPQYELDANKSLTQNAGY